MSAIEEVIGALQSAIDELEDCLGQVRVAGKSAEQGLGGAQLAGSGAAIEGYNQLADDITNLTERLLAARDAAETAVSAAHAVADST